MYSSVIPIISSKEKAVPCPEMLLENTLPVEDALKDDTNSPPEIEMIDEILCSPRSQNPELTICNEDQPPNLSKMEEDLSLVSLSVFGVRFRCPICEYIDVNVRFVRDHMKQCHKGKKDKEINPRRQEMKVKLKSPRVYKQTMLSALDYYKSFGGQFFETGVHVRVNFVPDPMSYIRNIKGALSANEDRPCPKRFKRKLSSDENKLERSESYTSIKSNNKVNLSTKKNGTGQADQTEKKLKRKHKTLDPQEDTKKRLKHNKKPGIPKVKLVRRGSTYSSSSSSSDLEEGKQSKSSPSDKSSDFSLNMNLTDDSETLASITNLLGDDPTTADLMDSFLSEETEINFDSIIEDQNIADFSEALIGNMSLEKTDVPNHPNALQKKNPDDIDKDNFKSITEKVQESSVFVEKPDQLENIDSLAKSKTPNYAKDTDFFKEKPNIQEKKKKEATTCHRCRFKTLSLKTKCRNKTCAVSNPFCDKCLASLHGEKVEETLKNRKWWCPPCRKICTCDSCKRTADLTQMDKNVCQTNQQPESFNVKEYEDYVKKANVQLRDFPWSKRIYSVKLSNIIDCDRSYRKILNEAKKYYSETGKKSKIEKESENISSNKKTLTLTPDKKEKKTDHEDNLRTTRKGRGIIIKEGEALQKLLTYLLGLLMKKDTNKWFSVPIDDKMAPGYSNIIKEKMDFTKMENKLDSHLYRTVAQFKNDFHLICNNCTTFNKPDTCYFKAAKKLKQFGNQLLSKRNLRDIVLDRPVYSQLTQYEIGFDVFDMTDTDEDVTMNKENNEVKNIHETPKSSMKIKSRTSSYDSSSECSYINMVHGNEIENIFISAAERVKFGRKRSQPISEKKVKLSKEGTPQRMKSTEKDKNELDSNQTENDTASLAHHDYLGTPRVEQSEENQGSIKLKTAEKIKNLHAEKTEGTYVQCCVEECKKWRFLTEYEDPSVVPEYWECSMNNDETANKCSIGDDDNMDDDVEFVNINFTCGSLVWARVKGYPWWPAIIDYCPDSEEYYWIEESESKTEPAWYHVVFLEKSVSRSWVRVEHVQKMSTPIQQPNSGGVMKNSMKSRFKKALEMAHDCIGITLRERLKKYSFASLFKGKWGEYSDISSEDEEETDKKKNKKKNKSRESIDPSRADRSNLEMLECEKCTENLIYTKYPVVKHLKKHRLTLQEYCLKFDPDEKSEKLSLMREWIDREEFRKAIAEDPWKPNKPDKSLEKKAVEEVVTENSPKLADVKSVYMTEEESEDFHINAALITNPLKYEKPQLSTESLIAVAVRNLDPQNKNGASFWQIVAFISLHFPYYDANYETCVRLVKKGYGQNPDDEKEPTGSFRIKPAVVQRLYTQISPILQNNKDEIEKSILHPKFLDLMVEKFLAGENYIHPRSSSVPPYNPKQLVFLALTVLKNPVNIEQIIIYLLFLFPGFSVQQENFKKIFMEEICSSVEIREVQNGKETRFVLASDKKIEVIKSLRNYSAVRGNFDCLKSSIFHEDFLNVLFPGLEIMEDQDGVEENLHSEELEPAETNSESFSATLEDNFISESQDKSFFLANSVLLFFVFAYNSNTTQKEKLTEIEIRNDLKRFFKIRKTDFVKEELKSEVYLKLPDNKFQINPSCKNFCVAALMKYLIDNLDKLMESDIDKQTIKSILPRMAQGAEKLRYDFLTQTVEFSKKKCQHWNPPFDEKLIFSFAIVSTADINDCASKSSILDFVHENFPWYRLTKEDFGSGIHEKKFIEADHETTFDLSSVETVLIRQRMRVMVTSNMEALKQIMPKMDIFNIVLGQHQFIPPDSFVYCKPQCPESVIVIISLLHIADKFGWSSALSIQKFVEINFPFYQFEMATKFLSEISNWTEDSLEGSFFNIKTESMMRTFQIKPEKFLMAYAWVSKHLKFEDNNISNQYKQFIRSPQLIRDILSLPPPSWKNFYAPEKTAEEVASTPLYSQTGLVTINRNIFSDQQTSNSAESIDQNLLEVTEWSKPQWQTHIKISLAFILWDIKSFHEEKTEASTDQDIPFTMFSFQQRHSLSNIVKFVRDAFPYYESKEHTKEFVVYDIQQNKKIIGEYFNLIKNEDGKLEYELKTELLGQIYEEITTLTEWDKVENTRSFLKSSDIASKVLGHKSHFSESSILSLILFLFGNPSENYKLLLESILKLFITEFDVRSYGFSGQRWSEAKLLQSLEETITALVNLNTDFTKETINEEVFIALKTEEGNVDAIFASLQKSCCAVTTKSLVKPSIHRLITTFMEKPTASSTFSTEPTLRLTQTRPEPPFPRNYLIALALKNLAPTAGTPVLMSKIWEYLGSTFPYFKDKDPWCMAELEVGIGFNHDTDFMYQVQGDDFSISVNPFNTEILLQEVAQFSKEHVVEIQKSMLSS